MAEKPANQVPVAHAPERSADEQRTLNAQRRIQERGIRRVVIAGLLLAITLLLAFTPIGFIPVPTPAGSATIAHIPTIIGGILEGPLVAVILALGFGFGSFFSPLVPIKDPLVIVLPRLLIGIAAWGVFAALRRASKRTLALMLGLLLILLLFSSYEVSKKWVWLGIVVGVVSSGAVALLYLWMRREDVHIVSLAAAGVVGSFANTIPVLSAAVLRGYVTPSAALGIGLAQGIPEAIVSGIVVVAVVAALRQIGQRRRGSRL
jgi:uncharacterized membrane protein